MPVGFFGVRGPNSCGTILEVVFCKHPAAPLSLDALEFREIVRMHSIVKTTHRAPADQPTQVREVAGRLLSAYTVEGGTVHLAGCMLDDRLFLRFDFAAGERTLRLFLSRDGKLVEQSMVEALGMDDTLPLEKPPEDVKDLMKRFQRQAAAFAQERLGDEPPPELQDQVAIWCKYATGKLRFTVGDDWADLSFSDWARTLQPPPYVCPFTGEKTYHVGATTDGRIAAAASIERCSETGQSLLKDDLVTCSITGRAVAPELVATCPVTGQQVLQSEMVTCRQCRQEVSPATIQRGLCAACRTLRTVSKADPRMARLLDEHPVLDQWGGWKLSETATVYVLTAGGWLKRLLLVVDKESLDLLLVATGNRLLAGWSEVEPEQVGFALRG
jgi:hypothetical protein